jgi:hypothetical protein
MFVKKIAKKKFKQKNSVFREIIFSNFFLAIGVPQPI